MITELHLIHHTHHDVGYTDLPSEAMDLHVSHLRQAVAPAEAHSGDADENSKFRWTCECLGTVLEAVRRDSGLAFRLDTLVSQGLVEVTALPWIVGHGGVDQALWESWLASAQPWYSRWNVKTAMQNDVNGLCWGMVPGLLDSGITALTMGINPYSGGPPVAPPDLFRWQGPDGRELVCHSGFSYPEGAYLFHALEWRRGPVPRSTNPWFHAPAGEGDADQWDWSPEALSRAALVCREQLKQRFSAWPHAVGAMQLTNMWRNDNDPPEPRLPGFVAAWNLAGLQPRLVLSTPQRFLRRLGSAVESAPSRRGDWQDWWTDALACVPIEQAAVGRAAGLLADLPEAARLVGSALPNLAPTRDTLWRWREHTFGSYDSVARPETALARGCRVEKDALAWQAGAGADKAWSQIARQSPLYCRSSRAAGVLAVQPREVSRGGWLSLPGQAVPDDVTGLALPDGTVLPFEDKKGPEWSPADADPAAPFHLPGDVWAFRMLEHRVLVPPMPAHSATRPLGVAVGSGAAGVADLERSRTGGFDCGPAFCGVGGRSSGRP